MYRPLASLSALVVAAGLASAGNWPEWRGPHGNGVCDERDLPVTWSATDNVRWKVPLPEPGNSTPVVWGDRLFLTQPLDKGKRRALVCYARADGKKLWQQEVPCSVNETTHGQNPHCSASPVTDGKAVYAYFASAGVLACDLNGKKLWHRDLGPVLHVFGNGASPTLYKDLLILFHGPGEPTFLTALDKHTGQTVWKEEEHALNHNLFGTWSTPILARFGERDELIMLLPGVKIRGDGWVKSYDPATGKELWRCVGLGASIYPSAVVAAENDVIVAASGFLGPVLAVKPGGSGDVTRTHRLWRVGDKNPQRVGCPVVAGGLAYLANTEPGGEDAVECVEALTGKGVWKQSLGGQLWGSLLLADGKLYVTSLKGKTFVLAAGRTPKLLATNDTGEATYASLAPSDGELYLRTWKHLYCIGKKQ